MTGFLIAAAVFVLLAALRLATYSARFRAYVAAAARRTADRLMVWLSPPDEEDELVAQRLRAARGERLRADVQRVRRLLATDEWMSATRQVANRLAYEWLLAELERYHREVAAAGLPAAAVGSGWDLPSSGYRPSPSPYAPRPPAVEVMDFGWRSSRVR